MAEASESRCRVEGAFRVVGDECIDELVKGGDGFWMKAAPSAIMPWRTTVSSL
jgi:hypothetical protein